MENQSKIEGNQNVVIQGVTDSTITLNVNGESQEVLKKLDVLQALLEKYNTASFQSANKIHNINAVTETNFEFLLNQATYNNQLPNDLADNLVKNDNLWVQSLREDLKQQNVVVGNKAGEIINHYGWLIEAFLTKMIGMNNRNEPLLFRLSYMTEAFQSSLRYLCYIQFAQILQKELPVKNSLIKEFIDCPNSETNNFDYLNLLLVTTDLLNEKDVFIPEINFLVEDLTDVQDDLYGTVLFLEKQRNKLLVGEIIEADDLSHLLDEYLTALLFWLRQISFLAKYRMISIKNINLNYRLGTEKTFEHLFGELHGYYAKVVNKIIDIEKTEIKTVDNYKSYSIKEEFTFNHSILLFKGSNVEMCLSQIKTIPPLSLSPLVIDQGVYVDKETQTPEIYYYNGKGGKREYSYAKYTNELLNDDKEELKSNKFIEVKRQNNNQHKLNGLFNQLEKIFSPFKNSKR